MARHRKAHKTKACEPISLTVARMGIEPITSGLLYPAFYEDG